MRGIGLSTNIASLQAQRSFNRSSFDLSQVFERLSSGRRINRASDDAAGLSIASRLNADARIYTAALRNINDGSSLLNVADSSLQGLSGVVTRLKELASQSANGTYSLVQRRALAAEADALTHEINRTVATTKFNGLSLFDPNFGSLSLQAGYGNGSILSLGLTQYLRRSVGDGTFQTSTAHNTGTNSRNAEVADFNNDGKLDLVVSNNGSNDITLLIGDGAGGFSSSSNHTITANPNSIVVADFNNDGYQDIAAHSGGSSTVGILINNRAGGFNAPTSVGVGGGGAATQTIVAGDFDGDGKIDLATANNGVNTVSLLRGTGGGNFSAATTITAGTGPVRIQAADFNADGKLDLAVGHQGATDNIMLFQNAGNFSFTQSAVIPTSNNVQGMATGDFNRDGIMDIAATIVDVSNDVQIFLGNSNGSFDAARTMNVGTLPATLHARDMNGDGFLDLVASDQSTNQVHFLSGNGNGTFAAPSSSTLGSNLLGIALGDFDGNGSLDVAGAQNAVSGTVEVALANNEYTTQSAFFSLASQSDALSALDEIDRLFERISGELGNIGSFQSRLASTLNTLAAARENSEAAAGRIVDADVASESANLVRTQILRDVSAAVLAQANSQSRIALSLLVG